MEVLKSVTMPTALTMTSVPTTAKLRSAVMECFSAKNTMEPRSVTMATRTIATAASPLACMQNAGIRRSGTKTGEMSSATMATRTPLTAADRTASLLVAATGSSRLKEESNVRTTTQTTRTLVLNAWTLTVKMEKFKQESKNVTTAILSTKILAQINVKERFAEIE